MTKGLAVALVGLTWAAAVGLPLVVAALLLLWGGESPNFQVIGLCVLAAGGGALVSLRATARIHAIAQRTRAEVLACLRNAGSADEARRAVRLAAAYAGDPAYAEQAAKLSDAEVLRLCAEILRRNESGERAPRR